MQLNRRLREVRMDKNFTQEALSERVDIALRTYQCYEQGRTIPSLQVLIRLADALGISIDYLVGRDEFVIKNDE